MIVTCIISTWAARAYCVSPQMQLLTYLADDIGTPDP